MCVCVCVCVRACVCVYNSVKLGRECNEGHTRSVLLIGGTSVSVLVDVMYLGSGLSEVYSLTRSVY